MCKMLVLSYLGLIFSKIHLIICNVLEFYSYIFIFKYNCYIFSIVHAIVAGVVNCNNDSKLIFFIPKIQKYNNQDFYTFKLAFAKIT